MRKLFILVIFLVLLLTSPCQAAVIWSELWDTLDDWWVVMDDPPDHSIGCRYPATSGNPVSLQSGDRRPGTTDSYAILDAPTQAGNWGCGITPQNESPFSFGEGDSFYVSYWEKFGSSNLFDSGAGKNADILGNGTRLVIGCPLMFNSWGGELSVPDPPTCSGSYRCAFVPGFYNETDPNRTSWPTHIIQCGSGGSNATMCQNINTSSPYYIQRGYWYRITAFVKVAKGTGTDGTGGRYRLWIKKAGEDEVELIDTDLNADCRKWLNTLGSTGNTYTHVRFCPMWNDHGGNGTNSGWQWLIDDAYVTTLKTDIPDDGGGGGGLTVSPLGVPSENVGSFWGKTVEQIQKILGIQAK